MSNRTFIEQELETIKEIYKLQKEDLFALWALTHFHFKGALDESTLEEAYEYSYQLEQESGGGDKALDGFYYDEGNNALALYQSKWPKDETSVLSVNEAEDVGKALKYLHADIANIDSLKPQRKEAAQALKKVLESGGSILLRGVAGASWNAAHIERIKQLLPADILPQVQIQLYGLKELYEYLAERTKDLSGETVIFRLHEEGPDNIIMFPPNGCPGLGKAHVAIISAFGLAEVAKKHGTRLFEKNVRLFQGVSKRSLNDEIKKTISEEDGRKTFWYGHNGITVLCDSLEVERSAKGIVRAIEARNPQIVNGCQTSETLADKFGEKKTQAGVADFGVTARFIALVGDAETRSDAAELIAYRSNSQQQVKDADLRSNDPVQRALQQSLLKFHKRWFYERKSGEWRKLTPAEKAKYKDKNNDPRRLDREKLQQAWRSYSGAPADAITNKGAIWDRGALLYEQVFNPTHRPCDIVLATVLFEWFAKVFSVNGERKTLSADIIPGLGNGENPGALGSATMRVAAHAVALFGVLVEQAYGALNKFPEADAIMLIDRLKRGKFVASEWGMGGVTQWGCLQNAFKVVFMTIANYIAYQVDKDEGETLYGNLKQGGEKALKDMKVKMLETLPANPKDLMQTTKKASRRRAK